MNIESLIRPEDMIQVGVTEQIQTRDWLALSVYIYKAEPFSKCLGIVKRLRDAFLSGQVGWEAQHLVHSLWD